MTHTPGPWLLDGEGLNAMVRGSNKTILCLRHRLGSRENEANMRLISAAPDLLEACKAVMEFLSNGTPVHPGSLVQAQVFNAISKAQGGT